MANDLNRAEFIGRLGQTPETRYASNGNAITNFSIACGETYKDKDGNKQDRTTWVPIVMFGKLAEIAGQYLTKGAQVYISGKFTVRKWQDKDGHDRYSTEIVANEMQMLGGKNAASSQPEANNTQQQHAPGADDFDDDIPF